MAPENKKDRQNPNVPARREAAPGTAAAAKTERALVATPDSSARFGKEECCVREFWAVVETDGTLVRGRNVWRTAKLGTGWYEVIFTGDVSEGAYVATIGRPEYNTEPSGEIGVALRCCLGPPEEGKGVWVDTHDSGGNYADRAFHLVVHV